MSFSEATTLAAENMSPRRGLSSHHGPSATRASLAHAKPFQLRALSGCRIAELSDHTRKLSDRAAPFGIAAPRWHRAMYAGCTRTGFVPRLYTVTVSGAL